MIRQLRPAAPPKGCWTSRRDVCNEIAQLQALPVSAVSLCRSPLFHPARQHNRVLSSSRGVVVSPRLNVMRNGDFKFTTSKCYSIEISIFLFWGVLKRKGDYDIWIGCSPQGGNFSDLNLNTTWWRPYFGCLVFAFHFWVLKCHTA